MISEFDPPRPAEAAVSPTHLVHATIDGRTAELPEGTTVLAALRALGIHLPHLCHDDRIAPIGACRLCLVRIGGVARSVASCMTALADGMVMQPNVQYPFVLVTGRDLHQFNAATMTGRTAHAILRPRDTLDVSPPDAARLSIGDGDLVDLESCHGHARLPARIDAGVRPGELFATFHTTFTFINRVTGSGHDPITHTPEYKRTVVRITRVCGEPPT